MANVVFTILVAMGQRVVGDKAGNSEKNPIYQAMVPMSDTLLKQGDKHWRNVPWDWPGSTMPRKVAVFDHAWQVVGEYRR